MSFDLGRSLLLADAVKAEALSRALLVAAARGVSLVRALVETKAIDPERLERELERGDAPVVRHVEPATALVNRLPPGLCERLLALPVREDARAAVVEVAVVDARDRHAADEIAFWLKVPVRVVRTPLASMESALRSLHPRGRVQTLAPPMWVPPPADAPPRGLPRTPAYGSPALDLAWDQPRREKTDDLAVPLVRTKTLVPGPMPVLPKGPRADESEPVLTLARRKSSLPPKAEALPARSATAQSPFSPNAPRRPFADVAPMIERMKHASDRDAVLEALIEGACTVARRAGVFAVRREGYLGWTCSREFADREALRAVKMPAVVKHVLSEAAERDAAHLGRVPKDVRHAPMLVAMSRPPAGEVALATVRVAGKPVAVVMADEMGDTMEATKRLDDLARAAGEALARLLREKQR